MNNDLEQFSEERLKDMQKHVTAGMRLGHADALLIRQEIGMALSTKRLLKVNAALRDINLNVSREAYSASVELNDFLKDGKAVYQIMNYVGGSQLWIDCSEDAYKCEMNEGGVVRILFTNPQPAHTEQDDTRRMNWLVSQNVEVRTPMPYGSHARFVAQCDSDDCEEYHTTLREQIDAAMLAAAPKPEGE